MPLLLTCAPRVKEENKLPQEPGRHLVATGHLQAQLIATDGRPAGAAHGEVDAVGVARCLYRTPGPSYQFIGEGKPTSGVLGLRRAWTCRGQERQHGGEKRRSSRPSPTINSQTPSRSSWCPSLFSVGSEASLPPAKEASPSFLHQAAGRDGLSPLGSKGPWMGPGVSKGLLGWEASMPSKGWDPMVPAHLRDLQAGLGIPLRGRPFEGRRAAQS